MNEDLKLLADEVLNLAKEHGGKIEAEDKGTFIAFHFKDKWIGNVAMSDDDYESIEQGDVFSSYTCYYSKDRMGALARKIYCQANPNWTETTADGEVVTYGEG